MKTFVQASTTTEDGFSDRISLTQLCPSRDSIAGAVEMSFSEDGEEVTFTVATPRSSQRITVPLAQAAWLTRTMAEAVEKEVQDGAEMEGEFAPSAH